MYAAINIRNLKKCRMISRRRLARCIGSTVYTVKCYEDGKKAPSGEHLYILSKMLGCTEDEFISKEFEESDIYDLLAKAKFESSIHFKAL